MNKKTIAFISYSLASGGAERVLTTLANEFCDTYNVVLISLTSGNSFYPLDDRITYRECSLQTENGAGFFSRLREYNRVLKAIKSIIKEYNVALSIGFLTVVNIFTILAAQQTKTKSIISERNNPLVSNPGQLWKFLRKLTYKKAHCLIVQTKANAEFFSKLIPQNRIKVVHNPIAPILSEKRIKPRIAHSEYSILSVGRLDRNKSQDVLLKAFANIPNTSWRIQLVGNGILNEEYKSLAKNLGIADKVEFLGNQTKIWEFYNRATIFAFTSKSEGFPNALIEALYFGLPSISTNCPHGPSELISDGENGFLIAVDNQKELEQKLIRLMKDTELRNTFSENAYLNSKKYEVSEVKNSWQNHFERLLTVN